MGRERSFRPRVHEPSEDLLRPFPSARSAASTPSNAPAARRARAARAASNRRSCPCTAGCARGCSTGAPRRRPQRARRRPPRRGPPRARPSRSPSAASRTRRGPHGRVARGCRLAGRRRAAARRAVAAAAAVADALADLDRRRRDRRGVGRAAPLRASAARGALGAAGGPSPRSRGAPRASRPERLGDGPQHGRERRAAEPAQLRGNFDGGSEDGGSGDDDEDEPGGPDDHELDGMDIVDSRASGSAPSSTTSPTSSPIRARNSTRRTTPKAAAAARPRAPARPPRGAGRALRARAGASALSRRRRRRLRGHGRRAARPFLFCSVSFNDKECDCTAPFAIELRLSGMTLSPPSPWGMARSRPARLARPRAPPRKRHCGVGASGAGGS